MGQVPGKSAVLVSRSVFSATEDHRRIAITMTGRTKRKGRTQASVGRQVRVSTMEDTKQLLEMAFGLHQAGELARARGLYEQIIERDPGHADALHFLGLACLQSGDAERAQALIARAIEHKPRVAPYYDNLGTVLESRGALDEALAAYRQAARLAGEDAERCFNTGVVLNRLGRFDEAEAAYRRAIDLAPGDCGFHYNLANLLKAAGRLEEAVEHYQRAIDPSQESARARNNLGNTLQALGRMDEAVAAYHGALEVWPDDPTAHFNLANVHREQSALDAAAAGYAKVLSLDPGHNDARLALGEVQRSLGRFDAALTTFETLLARNPDAAAAHVGLASVLRYLPVAAYRPALCACIKRCFDAPEVQAQDLAAVTAAQLRDKYGLDKDAVDLPSLIQRVGDDALLTRLLTRTINVDARLERFLTRARAHLILGPEDALASPSVLRLATAMAAQCFINEFVFSCSVEEAQAAARLRRRVEEGVRTGSTPDDGLRTRCALLAMFQPLLDIEGGADLARWDRAAWGEALWPLIEGSVCEALEERSIAQVIGTIGDIDDATSMAVREQYEHHPYPRWLELPRCAPVSYRDYLTGRFAHFTPPAFLTRPVEVLAAGCGTGQEAVAIAAMRAECRVLGLDLSRRSLAYAQRMAKKLGVETLRFVQGDLLNVTRLEQQFHVVESTGVLHHMAEPMSGWRSLVECLEARGLMKIGLYSERARADVVLARDEIRAASLVPVDADIRAFRERILSAAAGTALAGLAESEDLYTMSACRDLLFHTMEHHFTIPAIAAALDELGLEFIGFEPPAPGVLHDYRAFNPSDTDMTDLSGWQRFEAGRPELFSGLYVFWCQKRA
jgi:tetratricopeptide (TPR) repeat protein/SAM-dependent methyltransferase